MTKAGRATPNADEGFGQALQDARRREVQGEERQQQQPVKPVAKKEKGHSGSKPKEAAPEETGQVERAEEPAEQGDEMLPIQSTEGEKQVAGAAEEEVSTEQAGIDQAEPVVVGTAWVLAGSQDDATVTPEKASFDPLCGLNPHAARAEEFTVVQDTESGMEPSAGSVAPIRVAVAGGQSEVGSTNAAAAPVVDGEADAQIGHPSETSLEGFEPTSEVEETPVIQASPAGDEEVSATDHLVKDTRTDAGAERLPLVESESKAAATASTAKPAGLYRPANTPAPAPAEVRFSEVNHDRIVTGVRGQLLPHGGSMQIRLDPPELGALQVMVEMREGVMTATFQTSNDEATRLLSHSLNQLKHVLEAQGVSVEKLQVQQGPRNESGSSAGGEQGEREARDFAEEQAAKQEQQRKEILRRMWRKVLGEADPLDLVA